MTPVASGLRVSFVKQEASRSCVKCSTKSGAITSLPGTARQMLRHLFIESKSATSENIKVTVTPRPNSKSTAPNGTKARITNPTNTIRFLRRSMFSLSLARRTEYSCRPSKIVMRRLYTKGWIRVLMPANELRSQSISAGVQRCPALCPDSWQLFPRRVKGSQPNS